MGCNKEMPQTEQLTLLPELLPAPEDRCLAGESACGARACNASRFRRGSPGKIFIGDVSLARYLADNGKKWILDFRERLFSHDVSPFLAAYHGGGRRPYHPFLMLGLILYGMQQGRWSLRELEDLARFDVGAWWICGGLQPDHSTIGAFLNRHAELLSGEFFTVLATGVFRRLPSRCGEVAGDGTTVEAASSRFKMLTREAAELALAKAGKDSGPDSPQSSSARDVLDAVISRDDSRKAKGRGRRPARVCPDEPEAALQPRKDGAVRPCYKPSILADRRRLIVSQHVETVSEMAAVSPLLNQYRRITGRLPDLSLWDGAYNAFEMLNLSVELDMNVLCGVPPDRKASKNKRFLKGDFLYDETRDAYVCPAGSVLKYLKSGRSKSLRYREYRCGSCGNCRLRERCTTSRAGRSVIRYEGDELKEAMKQVMSHPAAKKRFRYRKAMVEPVFSVLRGRHRFERFHRKGLMKARLEFSLHCMAYNLRRGIRLEEAVSAFIFAVKAVQEASERRFELKIVILTENCIFLTKAAWKLSS